MHLKHITLVRLVELHEWRIGSEEDGEGKIYFREG